MRKYQLAFRLKTNNQYDQQSFLLNKTITMKKLTLSLYLTSILLLFAVGFSECKKDDSGTTSADAYAQSSGTVVKTSESFDSSIKDESAVKVTGGSLTLADCTITKSGNTSSSDNSSFYGQNAAILSSGSSSTIIVSGGTITTNATGANAVVAYGGTVGISGVTINCSGQYSRGIHATNSGKIIASDVTATTTGDNSSVIATDKGGGSVDVTGGTFAASGADAAVIYSTGAIVTKGITGSSANGEAIVIEGSNSASVSSSNLTAGSASRGILILQSGSGDATGATGTLSISGGSIATTSSSAPLIEVVTNSTGNIALNGTSTSIASGILLKVDYNTKWTTSGATANLALLGSITYNGNIVGDSYSTVNLSINSGTTWAGAFDNDNSAKSTKINIDGGTWTLTGNSNVDLLVLTNGATINKNGHALTYDALSNTSGTIND